MGFLQQNPKVMRWGMERVEGWSIISRNVFLDPVLVRSVMVEVWGSMSSIWLAISSRNLITFFNFHFYGTVRCAVFMAFSLLKSRDRQSASRCEDISGSIRQNMSTWLFKKLSTGVYTKLIHLKYQTCVWYDKNLIKHILRWVF